LQLAHPQPNTLVSRAISRVIEVTLISRCRRAKQARGLLP